MPRNARSIFLFLILKLALPLSAALPELSSIEPIEYDEEAQRLVARGDARLDFDGARISADRITYYQEYSLADATGNVAISKDGYRLITEHVSYDAEANVFSIGALRTGQWPFYISGTSAGGTTEDTLIEGATFYYGDPGPYALSVSSDKIRYNNEDKEYVELNGAVLRIGKIPFFYVPALKYYLDTPPYFVDLTGGSDGKLGTYLQTTTLFPLSPYVRGGLNLDYYSKRGVMAGPAAQYVYNSQTQQVMGAITTGYIEDRGSPDPDIFEEPIDKERGFAEWRHQNHIGERVTMTATASYWSDSEVTRDFRENYYIENQEPDSFAEGVYAGDNYFLSAFGRFRPNNFQLIQERLPEVRFDLLPLPLFDTGVYLRLSTSYAQLREDFGKNEPLITEESKSDRLDLTYRMERPFRFNSWLTFTPLAGARVTHYENQEADPTFIPLVDDQFTREIYELGFDLEARAYATYPTLNRTWDIDGLRHLVRPVLRYRYFSNPDALNEIVEIDRQVFDLRRPMLDLSDLRNVDQIPETHLARLGFENLFQTRAAEAGYGSRTLAALNFYQDILFKKGTRYDGGQQNTFNASWIEFVLHPAPWLKFDLASRFKTESLRLEELRTRTTIVNGEIWEIGLSTDLLSKQIEQYRLDFIYRFNERQSFLSDMRIDAKSGKITQTRIGMRSRIGTTWEVLYALTFLQDARRENDVQFTVQLSLAE